MFPELCAILLAFIEISIQQKHYIMFSLSLWPALCCQQKNMNTPLFCSSAILDPRVGHTIDVLSPFISILYHSD